MYNTHTYIYIYNIYIYIALSLSLSLSLYIYIYIYIYIKKHLYYISFSYLGQLNHGVWSFQQNINDEEIKMLSKSLP